MKILVLSEHYPNNEGSVTLMYVHTRNLYYKAHNIDVTVLCFDAKKEYLYDGIRVITQKDYVRENADYDLLVVHAANIRHHLVFLTKYENRFPKLVFFYHGHEVLRINKVYSKPYPYIKKDGLKHIIQDIYDTFKLFAWRHYLPKIAHKSHFVFVSKWMYDEFLHWTKTDPQVIQDKYSIIYNCIGNTFETACYDASASKSYDFVTVRGNIDGSKYSIDIINRLAFNTPDKKFLVIGKGHFFDHYPKAPNLEWRNQTMSHQEIIDILQKAHFALMPTRTDAQGLMMCEMAATGIPVITSDIPVCHEVFDGFENAFFIDNNDESLSLEHYSPVISKCLKDTRFNEMSTVRKEVDLFSELNNCTLC